MENHPSLVYCVDLLFFLTLLWYWFILRAFPPIAKMALSFSCDFFSSIWLSSFLPFGNMSLDYSPPNTTPTTLVVSKIHTHTHTHKNFFLSKFDRKNPLISGKKESMLSVILNWKLVSFGVQRFLVVSISLKRTNHVNCEMCA